MGQIWQELPGYGGIAIGLHCTRCGAPLVVAEAVTAVLRGVEYDYCGEVCRDRHAEVIADEPDRCSYCDLEAVGDTGRCDDHVDAEGESGADSYLLAS